MSGAAQRADRGDPDLIDRIAKELPADIRADYYREMMHCRSLPESDEMLRILRVMQFLTLLTERVPARVGEEREKLEIRLNQTATTLREFEAVTAAYHQDIDRRLTELPAAVAQGIAPEAIAATINESLRQQFARSTIPETAQALSVIAAQLNRGTQAFAEAAASLAKRYGGAAGDAEHAIRDIKSSVTDAAAKAQRAADELSRFFHVAQRRLIYTVTGVALSIGLLLGGMVESWIQPSPRVEPAAGPAIQTPVAPHGTAAGGEHAHDSRHVRR